MSDNDDRCHCARLLRVLAGGVEFRALRGPFCIDAIMEAKNELVRENNALRAALAGTKTLPEPPAKR